MTLDGQYRTPRGPALREALETLVLRARRVGLGPLLVRGGLFFAGLLAEGMAWPSEVTFNPTGLLLVLAAVLPAVAPHGRLVTVFLLSAVFGWLVATAAYDEPVAYWRLVFLAAGLYGVHTLAALAAVLPTDARVSVGVLAQWLLRAGVVMTQREVRGTRPAGASRPRRRRRYRTVGVVVRPGRDLGAVLLAVRGARVTSGLATVAPGQSLALLGQLQAGDFAGAMRTWRRLRPFEDLRARSSRTSTRPASKRPQRTPGPSPPDRLPPTIGKPLIPPRRRVPTVRS